MESESIPNKSRSRREAKPLIYVVDDEPVLLELATALLAPLECEVKTFLNAESALRAFADTDQRPDLVITDYAMHRMNGLELIVECRRLQPRQKIILTSGTVDESAYRSSPVKPDHFLAKPYPAGQFLKLVQSLLGR